MTPLYADWWMGRECDVCDEPFEEEPTWIMDLVPFTRGVAYRDGWTRPLPCTCHAILPEGSILMREGHMFFDEHICGTCAHLIHTQDRAGLLNHCIRSMGSEADPLQPYEEDFIAATLEAMWIHLVTLLPAPSIADILHWEGIDAALRNTTGRDRQNSVFGHNAFIARSLAKDIL